MTAVDFCISTGMSPITELIAQCLSVCYRFEALRCGRSVRTMRLQTVEEPGRITVPVDDCVLLCVTERKRSEFAVPLPFWECDQRLNNGSNCEQTREKTIARLTLWYSITDDDRQRYQHHGI